ncbi:MAG TPA: UDP-N-acetylglucosamine 2-epimerase [Candidatus Micrarchaeota archaeon]|nr:UDP-N-acetylglucosamine 2-epimerase [Candidatus Micrarchaeota archaeon]
MEKIAKAPHIIWEPCLPKYSDAMRIIIESDLVLTDSGGLQEETSSLHVPCLTLRYVTDRPESVASGGNKVVGCKKEDILAEVNAILSNQKVAQKMKAAKNPYGDGKTSARILDIIESFKGKMPRWETKVVKQ